MASKAAVDEFVVERRLRPIYEWLDLGLTRKAIQECDRVLKKQPSLQCARVLKGLALLRCGKPDDAEETITLVVSEAPIDDATLQALTIYYKETDQYNKICLAYEEATKKDGKNEELLSHLFMAYVRVGEHKKQQQAAMMLYKLKPKNPYYFWAVISLVMQSECGVDSNRSLCLALAERMVEKFYKQGKLDIEAEVLTYLYVLELQEKYVDALDLLESDLTERITQQPANFLALKRITYHLALHNWQQAHQIAKDLINKERDNWQHYENYCKSLLQLHDDAEDLSLLQEGCSFLREVLRSSEADHGLKYRAPHLALLLLARCLHQRRLQAALPALNIDVGAELLRYLRVFGHKWCTFSDVRPYLCLVSPDSVDPLTTGLYKLVTLDHQQIPTDVGMLHRHLTWLQVVRCVTAASASAHHHLLEADSLYHLYNATHHLACQTTATDIRRNDIYLLLAGHSVLQATQHLSDGTASAATISILIVKLIGALEAAVASSKANFQLKLLLLQLYNMIGACGSGRCCYDGLEIKSIQLDTLGHVAVLQALDAAHYSMATNICSATNSFFVSAAKDTCEPMIQAYKYGSLTRVPEFGRFRSRLHNSAHFAVVTTEQMLLELTYTVSSHKAALFQLHSINPVTAATDYAALLDNADHTVKIEWKCQTRSCSVDTASVAGAADPDSTASPGTGSCESAKPDPMSISELRVRQLILRLLVAAAQHPCEEKEVQRLQLVTEELDQLCQIKVQQPVAKQLSEAGTLRISGVYLSEQYTRCIQLHARLLLHLSACYLKEGSNSWCSSHIRECEDSVLGLLREAEETVSKMQCTATTCAPATAKHLHYLHHTTQTVGIVSILLGFCSTILRSVKRMKKNKKKKEAVEQVASVSEFISYTNSLDERLEQHHTSLCGKLDTAKQNSCNNSTLYGCITAGFAAPDTCSEETRIKALATDRRAAENAVDIISAGADLSRLQLEDKQVVSNGVMKSANQSQTLKPIAIDMLKTCLTIDSSYQESLDNLKTSIAAKRKYLASIKL